MSTPGHLYMREIGSAIISSRTFMEYVVQHMYEHEVHFDHPLIFDIFVELMKLCADRSTSGDCNRDLLYNTYLELGPDEFSIVVLGGRVGQRLNSWKLLSLSDEVKMSTC
jgi:hypothetical protein